MKKLIYIGTAAILTFAAAGAATTKERIQVVYDGSPANYRVYIFGGQALRCRGEDLRVSRDEYGDGDGPIILECIAK